MFARYDLNESMSITIDPYNFFFVDAKLTNRLQITQKEVKKTQQQKDINEIDNLELGINGYFQKLNFEVIDTYEIDVIHGNS